MFDRLLLVLPPQQGLLDGFSSGLIALANFVADREPGVHVDIVDMSRPPPPDLPQTIQSCCSGDGKGVLVGVTTTSASYQAALDVARAVKYALPESTVVFGGHHATHQDDVVLRNHGSVVDFVIRGEGERSLLSLVRSYPDVEAVPGLTWLRGGLIRRTAPPKFLSCEELDSLDVTFRGGGTRQAAGELKLVTYVSARGCPLQCAFCAVGGRPIRAKSMRRVLSDLRCLVHQVHAPAIAVEDNFFAQSRQRAMAFCKAIATVQAESKARFGWICQTRVECMQDADMVAAMDQAGCMAVHLGVESLIPRQLLYLDKTRRPEQYLRVLRDTVIPYVLRSSMSCCINLQVAVPGEMASDRDASLQSLRELGHAVARGNQIVIHPQLHVLYPGTRLCLQALHRGSFGPLGADVFEEFSRWEARERSPSDSLAEWFTHRAGGIPDGLLVREALQRGEFRFDEHAVGETLRYLHDIEALDGISVFKCGPYLLH